MDAETADGDAFAERASATAGALGLRPPSEGGGDEIGDGWSPGAGDVMIIVSPDWLRALTGACSWSDVSPLLPKSGFCPISSSEPPASLSASSRSSAACFITV